MRKDLVEHFQHERAHYNNFLSFDEQLSEEEKKKRYDDYLHDLSHNGHWNSDLADMIPLALSNIYRHPIRVYSRKVANSVYDILPDLGENNSSTDFIKVALFSITGQEHYDAVDMMDTPNSTNGNLNKTPTRENISSSVSREEVLSLLEKRANYKIPSHYTRKDSNRQYLSANLSLKKMFYLYEELCKKKGKKPCKINIYREIFCTEYNKLSIDQRKINVLFVQYIMRKNSEENWMTMTKNNFVRHQRKTRKFEDQKVKRQTKSKTYKSFVVSTFDLEAVLPTPCSMVGDLYYKRCLSIYNLSFYSLGDGKGTCYLWDEVNGGRGSKEIGSCILMHINSVAEKNSHLKEITFYSDTCSGQNRNEYVASAMLYALNQHKIDIEIINLHQILYKRGHSEMEADSIHLQLKEQK
ncbi:unnamed protein product [Mytilus coruscus]|uniref:OTU domain-containing protein n=1 Tax=Mytilus coruscus TaxID=42192 RepID=A0A6J8CEM0_MYTCO|nr:unnamed protein product [Mytilus coruscus]